MAEQSATTVTIRALIMLSCVVALTWVALFGTSLPEHVRSFLADGEQTDQAPPFTAPNETDAAPGQFASSPFGPSSPQMGTDGSYAPASNASNVVSHGATTPHNSTQWGQSADIPTWDASDTGTNTFAVGYNPHESSRQEPYFDPSTAPASGQSPAQIASRPMNTRTADLGGDNLASTTRVVDPFTKVQQQLQQLGVTYSSLETWGDQGLYYRFHCRVAVGGDPTMARPFQATDTDAVRAMTTVLQQIQQWQAGSL